MPGNKQDHAKAILPFVPSGNRKAYLSVGPIEHQPKHRAIENHPEAVVHIFIE
jgi:hypothetical protein